VSKGGDVFLSELRRLVATARFAFAPNPASRFA
jgi:hypothetical protein